MGLPPTTSGPEGPTVERRGDGRHTAYGFPLVAPDESHMVDCGKRGVGIETTSHLAVGSLTKVNVFLPRGELVLVGRVCWARLVESRPVRDSETQAVYRAGISFLDGQSFGAWDGLVAGLGPPRPPAPRPGRRVVKWRPPRARLRVSQTWPGGRRS